MAVPLYQVDAFTDKPFSGNPAAVCLLESPRNERWMQDVATEMNLSETAFVWPVTNGWSLRWFTPACEVDLCGHATLASAHVLSERGLWAPGSMLRLHSRSGLLKAAHRGDWIRLDFPALRAHAAELPEAVAAALGTQPRRAARAPDAWLVELKNEAAVRGLRPDFRALEATEPGRVIATARADAADVDIVSRFFAPAVGIDEDPVTGSAHCALGPYWWERLGKRSLVARQVSARGGTLRVEVAGERVMLEGQATTVLRGELVDE